MRAYKAVGFVSPGCSVPNDLGSRVVWKTDARLGT
jgi:hypothetical protein